MAKKKAATAGTGHFVMLKEDWPPAGFRRTVRGANGEVVRVLKFIPGEPVELCEQDFAAVEKDIGPALLLVDESADARRQKTPKEQPADAGESAQKVRAVIEAEAGKTLTKAEQLDRLYQLCGLLQHYRESWNRLEDAKRQDNARQHLFQARQAGLITGGDQDAGQDERDAIHSADMIQRLDSAIENWMPLVNQFFRLAILNRFDLMSPSFGQIEATQRMPHRIDSFDWQAFSDELRSLRHEIIRRQAELTDNATGDTKPEATKANQSSWPAGAGWEFRPGEAAFQGRPFAITGKPVVILQRLAEKPGEPVLKRILRDIIDPDRNAEEGCVRDSITEARAILRKAFKLGSRVDPIPNLARGPDAAWKLAEDLLCVATKNPR